MAAGITAIGGNSAHAARTYGISLAGWSLHRTIGEGEGKTPMLDMPRLAREEFGIEAIELVNKMLPPNEKPFDEMMPYLEQLKKNAADHNVKILLIMVDGEGDIGHLEEAKREEAVTRHQKWVDAAAFFGGHSIRMNWKGEANGWEKDPKVVDALVERSAPYFHKLCDYADGKGINVIIENHGGPSSNVPAMEKLMAAVKHPRFGTLPDYGNFPAGTDIYDSIDRLMPFAKAVSAKCYDFDDTTGLETKLDFAKLTEIVVDKHKYSGYIGIEFEGDRLSEFEGIKRAKALMDKLKA
ncbi:MAG: hypothetical protein AMXMBFR84_40650 [Candidatus Hydrogenedentota bacterium]